MTDVFPPKPPTTSLDVEREQVDALLDAVAADIANRKRGLQPPPTAAQRRERQRLAVLERLHGQLIEARFELMPPDERALHIDAIIEMRANRYLPPAVKRHRS